MYIDISQSTDFSDGGKMN